MRAAALALLVLIGQQAPAPIPPPAVTAEAFFDLLVKRDFAAAMAMANGNMLKVMPDEDKKREGRGSHLFTSTMVSKTPTRMRFMSKGDASGLRARRAGSFSIALIARVRAAIDL